MALKAVTGRNGKGEAQGGHRESPWIHARKFDPRALDKPLGITLSGLAGKQPGQISAGQH